MMQWYRFSLLSVCLLLSSCNVIEYVTWTGREPQSQTKDDSGLIMTLSTDHYCYKENESILVRFTLGNTSDKTVILEGNDGPAADIVAVEENRNHTISWAETEGEVEDLNTIELEPNETYEIEWTLLPPAFTGYLIRGVRVRYGAEFDEASNVNYPPCRGDG